jgi:hypothetical protein
LQRKKKLLIEIIHKCNIIFFFMLLKMAIVDNSAI